MPAAVQREGVLETKSIGRGIFLRESGTIRTSSRFSELA
jgi:hypothetical protein